MTNFQAQLIQVLPSTIGGVVMIILGICLMSKKTAIKIIKWQNEIAGTKTQITPKSILVTKIGGIVFIVISLVIIFTSLSALIQK